jgi:hypothetical protein
MPLQSVFLCTGRQRLLVQVSISLNLHFTKKKKKFFIYSEPIPVHSSVNMGLNYTEDILLSGPALLIDCVHANPAAYV